jgi:hypothetical protein
MGYLAERAFLMRSIERSRRSPQRTEVHALSLKEDGLQLPAPEYRARRRKITAHDEEETRWAGIFVAAVGVTLMVLSTLDGGLF